MTIKAFDTYEEFERNVFPNFHKRKIEEESKSANFFGNSQSSQFSDN